MGAGDGDGDEPRIRSLASITGGASLYTVGKVVSDAGEFVLHLLVSRWLGAGPYGLFAYGKTLAFMTLLLTNLGADKSILKYLPQYADEPATRRFLLGLAWFTSVCGAAAVTTLVFIFAPAIADRTIEDPQFVAVIRLFAVILFLDTIANLLYATFRALEIIEYEVATKRLLKPVLRVVAVGSAIAVGASVYGVVVAMGVTSAVTLAVASWLFVTRTEIRPSLAPPDGGQETVRSYYNYSLPLTAKEAGTLMQGRMDVLLVGLFLSSTAVGVYNVSVLVGGLLYVPLLAFNQLFPPVAARLYAADALADLETIYTVITRWILSVSLLCAIAAIVYRVEILTLFGPEFTAGTTVLTLIVLSQLCNCATGPSDYLLMMTDHQYVVMANEWVFGIANVALTVALIGPLGIVGAALASAGVLAVRNLAKVLEVWYFEGLHPYSRAFYKPIGAGILAGGVMVAASQLLSPLGAVAIGLPAGTLVYAGTLSTLGIEPIDYRVYSLLKRRSETDGAASIA